MFFVGEIQMQQSEKNTHQKTGPLTPFLWSEVPLAFFRDKFHDTQNYIWHKEAKDLNVTFLKYIWRISSLSWCWKENKYILFGKMYQSLDMYQAL